jgi:DNA-directed RNA polymerase specialized sigma24 family protein
MTLEEAFCLVSGSGSSTDAGPGQLDTAQSMIYQELHALARRCTRDRELGEESASRSFQRLVLGGPRSVGRDDRVVQSYLWRMVANGVKDLRRQQQRELESPPEDEVVDSETPEGALIAREEGEQRARLASWATSFVFGTLAEQLASRRARRSHDDFRESVRQMDQLVRGAVTFDDIVARECGTVNDQTRSRVYQRHCRVRRSFLMWLTDEMPEGAFSDSESAAIKRIIALLRR